MDNNFQPRYVQANELKSFGLPTEVEMPDILTLVDRASWLIDEYCGRRTEDNNGSILYSTYEELLSLDPRRKNVVRLTYRPIVAVSATTQQLIAASGAANPEGNFYDTGFTANTINANWTNDLQVQPLSPILQLQGSYTTNPNMLPADIWSPFIFDPTQPRWVDISIPDTFFNLVTGDIWIPTGLYPVPFGRLRIVYNAGQDPLNIPKGVKFATASLVRNLIMRGGGTTGLKGYSGAGKMTLNFTDDLIDSSIDLWLRGYKVVISRP